MVVSRPGIAEARITQASAADLVFGDLINMIGLILSVTVPDEPHWEQMAQHRG